MITDNIILFEAHGRFVLIDNCTYNMFLVSKTSFKILQALKKGNRKTVIEEQFGKNNVDKVTNSINRLKENEAIRNYEGDLSGNGRDAVNRLIDGQPKLAEGVFMLAQDCNMKCRYCFGGSGQFGSAGMMSKEMAENYFKNFIKNQGKSDLQKVKFLGGEPLLNFDTMKHILDLWERLRHQYTEKRVSFSFTTNGTLFTPEIVQYLKDKGVGVTISLDGPADTQNNSRRFRDGTSTFDSVMKGIKLLEQYHVNFAIRATVTSDTNLEELYEYFCSKNFQIVHILPVDFPLKKKAKAYQWDLKQYKDFVNNEINLLSKGCRDMISGDSTSFEAKQMQIVYDDMQARQVTFPFKCSAGWWSAAFSSDGYIYPCHRMVGNEHYRIGDHLNGIQTEKIKEIYSKILDASTKCDSCMAYTRCKRRCMAQMALPDGNFTEIPEQLCDIYRDMFKHSLSLFLKVDDDRRKGKQYGSK